jgi:glycolate oxidase FAD binding subunit
VEPSITIDSFGPLSVERPATVAELRDLVSRTRAAKHAVYPVGGRTALDYGLPPSRAGVACDTTALASVIDYPARDMTITVQAGVTLAALQAELAQEGQWLPIDVPSPEKATLGGAVAVNASGPRRYGYGTLRDYVIGLSFVTDDGTEVKAGGRVVKNVAGYDLMKLQIGALGTLGIVTQLTLKVKPKPESSAAVAVGCDTPALAGVLDRLAASRTRPVAAELLNRNAWRAIGRAGRVNPLSREHDSEWVVLVAFEEKAAAVRWQVETLLSELKDTPGRDAAELPGASVLDALTALQRRPESRLIGRLSVLPSKLAEAVVAQRAALVHAHALNGVVWLHDDEAIPPEAVLVRAPVELKRSRGVWGALPGGWELMRHVKRALDPDGVFNPGRLFGDV